MNINKKILEYCPNFYKIIEFSPYEDDVISAKLIKIYQQYIFRIDINSLEDIECIKQLDHVISRYIDDYLLRKEIKSKIVKIKVQRDGKDFLRDFIKSIIKIFNDYEEYTTRVIYISRWI